jgi:hypothetical protein
MKRSQQNRRIGILCLILSAVIFGLTLLSDAKAESYWQESSPVPVLTKRGVESIVPVSPLFICCKQMASRFFAVSAVAFATGMLLVERARMMKRVDALETEVFAMRALITRS